MGTANMLPFSSINTFMESYSCQDRKGRSRILLADDNKSPIKALKSTKPKNPGEAPRIWPTGF